MRFSARILACSLAAAGPALADDRADIRAAAQAFQAAQQAGDAAALGRLLAPDFLFVRGTGEVGDRRDFLAGFAGGNGALRIAPAGDPLLIRPAADSAVVGGAAEATVREAKRSFRQRFRFSEVLARRSGQWLVVYLHVAALP